MYEYISQGGVFYRQKAVQPHRRKTTTMILASSVCVLIHKHTLRGCVCVRVHACTFVCLLDM